MNFNRSCWFFMWQLLLIPIIHKYFRFSLIWPLPLEKNRGPSDLRKWPKKTPYPLPLIHTGKYLPHNIWKETLTNRKEEEALGNRHMRICERLTAHSHTLLPLKIRDSVRIQNQTGPHPTKLDKTDIIVEGWSLPIQTNT